MNTVPISHPAWCSRSGCEDRGWHAGRPLTAVQSTGGPEPVSVQLVQLFLPSAEPQILLKAAPEALLTIAQTRILRRFLGRLVDTAGRS